jgi:hypothetical protein
MMKNPQNPLKGWRFTHPDAFAGHCSGVKVAGLLVLALIGWLDYITGYFLGFYGLCKLK